MRVAAVMGAVLAAGVAGCDSASAPEEPNVLLEFRYDAGMAATSGAMAASAPAALVIEGTDGATLEITELRLVVDELKLEREQDACEGLAEVPPELEDHCVRFEAPPCSCPCHSRWATSGTSRPSCRKARIPRSSSRRRLSPRSRSGSEPRPEACL